MIGPTSFRVRNATWGSAIVSLMMHAVVLVGVALYAMRVAPMHAAQPEFSVLTAEVLLHEEPVAQEEGRPARPLPRPVMPVARKNAATGAPVMPEVTQDARVDSGPLEQPVAATKPVMGNADASQIESKPSPVNVATSAAQPDRQATQSARPDYAFNPQPDYPMLLREHGIGGVVWVRVWVDSEGRPAEIKLAKGSGYRLLDDAALRAVRVWRFIPAQNGTQRLASWVEFPIRFTLDS